MPLGPTGKFLATAGAGAGLTIALMSGGSGEHSFRDTLDSRLSSAAAGKVFSTDGLRVEPTTGDPHALATAEYNMAENLGADNPNKPDAHTRATTLCALGAASLPPATMAEALDKWNAAHEADQNDDSQGISYNQAAQACGGVILTH